MRKIKLGKRVILLNGDCLEGLKQIPDKLIQTCVTSPPYFGLRDYGHKGQIGQEETPDQYIQKLVDVFREVRRTLKDDGTLWINIGDSYAANRGSGNSGIGAKQATNVGANLGKLKVPPGYKAKDLIGIPWMLAFALRADGWYLRQDIIWHKPNVMPESVRDRCTKSHEYIFLLSKKPSYLFDASAIKEPALSGPAGTVRKDQPRKMNATPIYQSNRAPTHTQQPVKQGAMGITADGLRNRRSVWSIATKPYKGAHFAVYPTTLVEPCILAGSKPGDIVLDPFNGSGTTGQVALEHGRRYVGCELNPDYVELTEKRLATVKDKK